MLQAESRDVRALCRSAAQALPHFDKDDLIDGDELLLLHHGTTLRAANRIVDAGWQTLDVQGLIDRIASEHRVAGASVRELLTQWGRFAVIADGRGTNASFAPSAQKVAHRWAQRAPEAEWEILWAVYHLLHPDTDAELNGWDSDVAGRAWVWNRMRHEPLAVLTFATNYAELAVLDARESSHRMELGPRDDVHSLWTYLTEISFDLPFRPDPARLFVTPIARHLPRDVYAHELGLTLEEFDRRAGRGDFGIPASDGLVLDDNLFVQTPWWDSATAPMIGAPDA